MMKAEKQYLFTGGYQDGRDGGISCYQWSDKDGKWKLSDRETHCVNPSFLVFDQEADVIYAANETEDKARITAHRFDRKSGKLERMNTAEAAGGGMCHLALNKNRLAVYGADYSAGNVVAFRIKPDGSLGEEIANIWHSGGSVHERQKEPHVHQVLLDPLGRRLIVVDLGTDALYAYPLSNLGVPLEKECVISHVPAGEGPRHLVFDPCGTRAYVITEIGCRLLVCSYDAAAGSFEIVQSLDLAAQEEMTCEVTGAEIIFSPDYSCLYLSIRGLDRIVVVSMDEDSGRFGIRNVFQSFGKMPRMICLDGQGKKLLIANQESGEVAVVEGVPDAPVVSERLTAPEVSFVALFNGSDGWIIRCREGE